MRFEDDLIVVAIGLIIIGSLFESLSSVLLPSGIIIVISIGIKMIRLAKEWRHSYSDEEETRPPRRTFIGPGATATTNVGPAMFETKEQPKDDMFAAKEQPIAEDQIKEQPKKDSLFGESTDGNKIFQ